MPVDAVAELGPAIVVDPAHGVALLGAGTLSMGLTPPLSISVAPSGIVPPLSEEFEVTPGLDSGEAVAPEDSSCVDAQLDIEVADPATINPPPSKVEVAPVVIPVVPEAFVPNIPKADPPALQFAVAAGLRPPGSISVAPSGIPLPLDPLEPSVPRGDVAPIADVPIELCACPAPQLISISAAIGNNLRIDTSCLSKDERYARGVPLN
jgi:hypothetical protein